MNAVFNLALYVTRDSLFDQNSIREGKENRSENLFIIFLGFELLRPVNKGIGDFEATGSQLHARHDISYGMLLIHRICNPLDLSELTICD